MIYSRKKKKQIFVFHLNFIFSRLKSVKIEYIHWKKKIDDGFKQMNSIDDEQIIEQYKSFYQVRKKQNKLNFIFI